MLLDRGVLPATIEHVQGEITHSDENSIIGLLRIAHFGGRLLTTPKAREHIARYTNVEGDPPRAAMYIARFAFGGYMDEEEAAGYVATQYNQESRGAAIEHLIVHPAARGTKLGRALMSKAIEFAHTHQAEYVAYTAPGPHSEEGLRLLQRFNFRPDSNQIPTLQLTAQHNA